ncbi:acylphosphatase [Xanthobacter sp. TB0139]|uniref:acylphosphatase n=1 Tax=Xanthobacter sp. TB0139 TaxID=3459178 RepID=UPI0040393CA0
MRVVRVMIGGRVQGVSYRAWCADTAQNLGLSGWVRNRRSGQVEALFAGVEEDVTTMLKACEQGPVAARVEKIELHDATQEELPQRQRFSILETL